jgi:hypothetical protein
MDMDMHMHVHMDMHMDMHMGMHVDMPHLLCLLLRVLWLPPVLGTPP